MPIGARRAAGERGEGRALLDRFGLGRIANLQSQLVLGLEMEEEEEARIACGGGVLLLLLLCLL